MKLLLFFAFTSLILGLRSKEVRAPHLVILSVVVAAGFLSLRMI